MKKRITKATNSIFKEKNRKKLFATGFITLFAIVGIIYLVSSYAALLFASAEPENGQTEGCVSILHDSQAAGGKAIEFKNDCNTSQRGANLPINYNLNSLSGTIKYVAENGLDTASGSAAAPYKTLAKAIASSNNNGTIVIRGGTYREGNLNINKSLRIIAYPGEVPIFTGAQDFNGGWTAEGSLGYRAYSPQPITNGSGISFTTGQNQTADQMGKHPDQLWIGGKQLKQISQKSQINNNSFWVDSANKRLYVSTNNTSKTDIEASSKNIFAIISSPNTSIEGLHITRYSDSAADSAVVLFRSNASNSSIISTKVSESAFTAVKFGDDARVLNNVKIDKSTIERSNWMGVVALYTDNFLINDSLI